MESGFPYSVREIRTTVEGYGLQCLLKAVEIGKGYGIFLIYLELPNAKHIGFSIKIGDTWLTKGEIGRYIRELNIEHVEAAMPPPANTNAILMVRLESNDYEEILRNIAVAICDFLHKKALLKHRNFF